LLFAVVPPTIATASWTTTSGRYGEPFASVVATNAMAAARVADADAPGARRAA
jgi:hypothetical protein